MLINAHTHHYTEGHISVLNFYPHQDTPKVNPKQTLLSCGIHPWYLKSLDNNDALARLTELCSQKMIHAIGECGLDKNTDDLSLQKSTFIRQIELSEKYKLPLIIHSVRCHHLVQEIRKQTHARCPWIFHGFTGSFEMADQLIKQNIFISLGSYLLRQPAKAKLLLNKIDLNYVLFETDDSDIDIEEIYNKASLLTGKAQTELEKITELNFKRIFF